MTTIKTNTNESILVTKKGNVMEFMFTANESDNEVYITDDKPEELFGLPWSMLELLLPMTWEHSHDCVVATSFVTTIIDLGNRYEIKVLQHKPKVLEDGNVSTPKVIDRTNRVPTETILTIYKDTIDYIREKSEFTDMNTTMFVKWRYDAKHDVITDDCFYWNGKEVSNYKRAVREKHIPLKLTKVKWYFRPMFNHPDKHGVTIHFEDDGIHIKETCSSKLGVDKYLHPDDAKEYEAIPPSISDEEVIATISKYIEQCKDKLKFEGKEELPSPEKELSEWLDNMPVKV